MNTNPKSENRQSVFILAIETSCDETSVAIVENGKLIRSNVVLSQVKTHQKFGGVVPEVASRQHVESITQLIEQALQESSLRRQDLSAIAVTQGPGLVGALLVGIVAAKALAFALDIPLLAVHHIAGHIYANQLIEPMNYPFVALVVSGGHTELVYVKAEGQFQYLGRTRDDAAGEAYDKVARALQLPYPGGPHIDRIANEAESMIDFPKVWLEPETYDFSFSGLKSAVLNQINQSQMRGVAVQIPQIAKGFQEAVIEVLVGKTIRACQQFQAQHLVLAGGVAANQALRKRLTEVSEQFGLILRIPPLYLCTDNAAMIGAAAFVKWNKQEFSSLDFQANPSFDLENW